MSKQEQSKRLYQAVERLALQAGEDTDETIDWLCGEHGGMAKLFEKYFSPSLQHPREFVGLTDEEKRGVCRVGPMYAPDGVVTRTPLEYRKELEGVALMAVRQAEAKLKEKNT